MYALYAKNQELLQPFGSFLIHMRAARPSGMRDPREMGVADVEAFLTNSG